jgi:hypothetical protein
MFLREHDAASRRRGISNGRSPAPFAAVTTAEAKLERILGPGWPALSVKRSGGIVVARIAFSPLFVLQLIDALNSNWRKYAERRCLGGTRG